MATQVRAHCQVHLKGRLRRARIQLELSSMRCRMSAGRAFTAAAVLLGVVSSCAALGGCKKPRILPVAKGGDPAIGDDTRASGHGMMDDRQKLLEDEWNKFESVTITHSAGDLTDGERAMLRHLLEAANVIEELYMLQLNPSNLDWRDRIMSRGTDIEKKVFVRYQMPWCSEGSPDRCCTLADCPARSIGAVHWPPDMTQAELDTMGSEPNVRELISPFTIVRRKSAGGFFAGPFTQTEMFGPRMETVAAELRAAAATAPHGSLEKFLLSRADAFEAADPYPFDDSDYDWIALEGEWEVTVGPYETCKDRHQIKAMFQMYIGKEDTKLTAEMGMLRENLQDMEDALAELIGREVYLSRKLDESTAIRAVEVWIASGGGRHGNGATAAYHLPNHGRCVVEGLTKKVMMVNHAVAFESVMKARAGLILDETQADETDIQADITNVVFHELAHSFGAYDEMRITTYSGKMCTVEEALGELESLFEELKADTLGLWLLSFQKGKGWVTGEQVEKRQASAVMHILGLLTYPLSDIYARMVAVQLGYYMDQGAVSWNAQTGRFSIDHAKMPAAVEALVKKVATIQLTGDRQAARVLYETYVTDGSDGQYTLVGELGEARTVMMKKFEKAGIRSPSLLYEVTDL